jgi:hypothetical protein
MIWFGKTLIACATVAVAASPAFANAMPPGKRPVKPPIVKPVEPGSPEARVQMTQQRVIAARNKAVSAQKAYFMSIGALQALKRTHAPLIRERNRQQAALAAESVQINQAISQGRPGIGQAQAAWRAKKAIYDANVKAPTLKALEEINVAEKNVALKRWEHKAATDSVADAVGDRSRARVDAQKAAEVRALENAFPAVPAAMASFNPRPPRAVPAVDDSADVSTSANAVTPPGQLEANDNRALAQAAVDAAKARRAARDAQAAVAANDAAANASTSSTPAANAAPGSASPRRGPVNPIFQKLPQAPVIKYEQLPPNYQGVPPGTQRQPGQ